MKKYYKNFFLTVFLKKIFLIIFSIIVVFLSGFFEVSANDGVQESQKTSSTTDWTSSSFRINLSDYDPINHNQAKGSDSNGEASGGDWKGLIKKLLEKISNLMLMIIPIFGAVSLIIAGYFYIFSFADEENVTKAKTIIKYNLLAMLVAFGSWAIISTIASFFK